MRSPKRMDKKTVGTRDLFRQQRNVHIDPERLKDYKEGPNQSSRRSGRQRRTGGILGTTLKPGFFVLEADKIPTVCIFIQEPGETRSNTRECKRKSEGHLFVPLTSQTPNCFKYSTASIKFNKDLFHKKYNLLGNLRSPYSNQDMSYNNKTLHDMCKATHRGTESSTLPFSPNADQKIETDTANNTPLRDDWKNGTTEETRSPNQETSNNKEARKEILLISSGETL
ncbi:unnamed protein product [Lepeophtheirus salmonis]|uniref:(salmon louse) hypothetical protein n=1 Tax=Lepeophtheirus salmonis TaxID=72036 RepID=A0A7R8D643_LEPSM|nr:unnamed protein product [Lepeophtheirus salmonis]CAF3037369.1 unnamed protein product [Lepeophtheirus salmonis]